MGGRATASERVIIHAGKIIVNQGVGVKDFNGNSWQQRIFRIPPYRFTSGQAKDRAQAFAASHDGIPHSPVQDGRAGSFCREHPVQFRLNGVSSAIKKGIQIKHVFTLRF